MRLRKHCKMFSRCKAEVRDAQEDRLWRAERNDKPTMVAHAFNFSKSHPQLHTCVSLRPDWDT